MLNTAQKQKVTQSFQRHKTDTGSPEYQIALLTEEIRRLTLHLQKSKNDIAARRGLIRMVNRRRRLLEYLKRTDEKAHAKVVKKLGLKSK